MKRLLVLVVALAVIVSVLMGLPSVHSAKAQGKALKIGLVTDVGKVDDRSFNQSAWEGAQAGAQAVGGTADYIETQDPSDYANNIEQFASKDYDVIITVGFAFGDTPTKAAAKYPNIHFITVDVFQANVMPNVTGLVFPEAKPGFLAGVLAAHMSKSGIIAAVLGTDQVPPVVNYKEGYEAGAKYVNPNIKILSTYYPGDISKAFIDPEWGATTAGQAMDQGADVVFGAGGKTGNGALQEVAKRTTKDKPLYCIGVDTDQWETLPEAHPCLITSAEKLITPGIVKLIQQVSDGTIQGGNFTGDFGLAPFHDFDSVVPDDVKAQITKIQADLTSGALQPNGLPGTPEATMEGTMSATMSATVQGTMSATMAPTSSK